MLQLTLFYLFVILGPAKGRFDNFKRIIGCTTDIGMNVMKESTIKKLWFLAAGFALLTGLLIFVDDLHDFVPGTEWLHWLPDFTPVYIGNFHFEHLYVGAAIILIGLSIAVYAYTTYP